MKPCSLRRTLAVLSGAIALAAEAAVPRDFDAPEHGLKIIRTHPIIFPARMIQEGILHGEARIAFHIDHEGRLVDSLAVAYSAKPFADCAIDAVQRWKFIPQRSGDRPAA
ncbi:MAG: energy transducer TonB, partial [Verrucomicrobia bacterium]|nr:energy transducer TonB [Verrucomicrobiota bacterium]